MINVGSEKGFYFSNPRDYLDGKINDINSIAYSAYTIDRSESIYRKEVSGWGTSGFTFYDCDSGISMTKDEFAKIITENFADFDYPFFVQKMKPSLTWRNENSVFSTEDLDLYEQLLNQSDDKSYIVDIFREKARKISKSDLPAYLVLNVKFFPDTYAFYSENDNEREKINDFDNRLKLLIEEGLLFDGKNASFKEHTIYTKTSKIINGGALTSVKDINGNVCEVGDEVYYSRECGRIDAGIITKFTDISIFIDDYCLGKVAENDILLKKKKTS
jgi:hypothetical protein